jgi:ATP-dependent protease ClpP protease subunit
MKTWYSIVSNKADQSVEPEIIIYDDIGAWGISAQQFLNDFKTLNASAVTIRISSAGGDQFQALAIYNYLISQKKCAITVRIDGWAASAATIIACAGSNVIMAETAFYVIHNTWNYVVGDTNAMQKAADILAALRNTLVNVYAKFTGLPEADIVSMMDAETWLSAEQAKEKGFVNFIGDPVEAAALVSAIGSEDKFKMFKNIPENFKNIFNKTEDKPMTPEEMKLKLEAQKNEVAAVTAKLADAEGKLTAESAKVADLNAKVAAESAKVVDFTAKLAAETAKVVDVEAKLTAETAKVADVNAKLAAETAKVAEYQAKISGFNPQGSQAPVGMDAVKARMQKNLDKMGIK